MRGADGVERGMRCGFFLLGSSHASGDDNEGEMKTGSFTALGLRYEGTQRKE